MFRQRSYKLVVFLFLLVGYNAEGQQNSLIDKLKANNVSIIEINTAGSAQIVSREEYLNASYTLYTYKDGGYSIFTDSTEIKGRGNSTWDWPKKPFRLKLKTAKSLLSMPSNKHWALLANFIDKTLSRNKVAMDLGSYLGLPYSPRSDVVELVVNGWHWGSYQLSEVPKISTDRVNITAINTKNENITGGVIFELDERLGEQYYFNTNQQLPVTIKEPDDLNTANPIIASKHLNYVSKIFKNAEDALFSINFIDTLTGYKKYFNIESVYNWYLVQEIFKNVDISKYSVFFYIDTRNNNKITFGPLWDFDMSSGAVEDPFGIRVTDNVWINRFYQDSTFLNTVKSRWAKNRPYLLEFITSKINENARKLHFSQQTNFNFWNEYYGLIQEQYITFNQEDNYEDDIFYFKKWMNQRLSWLDKQFSTTPFSFMPITRDNYHDSKEDNEIKGLLKGYQSFDHNGFFKVVNPPKHGQLNLNKISGEYIYTPKANFNGNDTLLFIYNDGYKNSDTGLVNFKILPVNDLPITNSGTISLMEDEILERNTSEGLLSFSKDVDEDLIYFEITDSVKHGKLNFKNDGSFVYIPNPNYFGEDTFYFKAFDHIGSSNTSFIIFNVSPVNDPPEVRDSSYLFQIKNSDRFIFDNSNDFYKNIFDIDNDKTDLTIELFDFNTTKGIISRNVSGYYVYSPKYNYSGLDSVKLIVNDSKLFSKVVTLVFRILNDKLKVDSDNIILFPNPTNYNIKLKNIDVNQIVIEDLSGAIYPNIPFFKIGNDIIVDCSKLPNGNFLIQLIINQKLIGIKKFFKL